MSKPSELMVRWGKQVIPVLTCLSEADAARSRADWPDGIVDLATLLDEDRPPTFSYQQRVALARLAFRELGEPLPDRLGLTDGLTGGFTGGRALASRATAPAAAVGAFAARRTTRPVPTDAGAAFPKLDYRAEIKARAARL